MNRQDETDHLTEQVHRLDFATALRREEEQMASQRADTRMPLWQASLLVSVVIIATVRDPVWRDRLADRVNSIGVVSQATDASRRQASRPRRTRPNVR